MADLQNPLLPTSKCYEPSERTALAYHGSPCRTLSESDTRVTETHTGWE